MDDENQVLLDNSENDYGRNYGNGNSKTNSRSQNTGFNEFKNGFRKNLNADNYENRAQSSSSNKNDSNIGIGIGSGKVGGDVRYASPYRSYGASDILIKSSTYFLLLLPHTQQAQLVQYYQIYDHQSKKKLCSNVLCVK